MKTREDVLAVGAWWRGIEKVPARPREAAISVIRPADDAELALICGSVEQAVAAKRAAGNVPYVARLGADVAGYVWVARRRGHIPPLGLSFELPGSDRMIMDLHVLEAGKGLAVCPQLVQAVIEREKADRFWAVVQPEHAAEIERGGFEVAAHVYRVDGVAAIEPGTDLERARVFAQLAGIEMPRRRATAAA